MHFQVQHRVPPQFHLLLSHFVHTYALTIAWTSAAQVQAVVHFAYFHCIPRFTFLCIFIQILKRTFRCNFRCIISCTLSFTIKRTLNQLIVVPFAFSCALSGALKSSLLLSTSRGAIRDLMCSSKLIIDCSLKCTMIQPTYVSFIVL